MINGLDRRCHWHERRCRWLFVWFAIEHGENPWLRSVDKIQGGGKLLLCCCSDICRFTRGVVYFVSSCLPALLACSRAGDMDDRHLDELQHYAPTFQQAFLYQHRNIASEPLAQLLRDRDNTVSDTTSVR